MRRKKIYIQALINSKKIRKPLGSCVSLHIPSVSNKVTIRIKNIRDMLFWRRVRSYPNVSRGRQLSSKACSGIRQWRLRNLELSKDGKVVVEKVWWRMILDVTHRQYLPKNSKIRFTVRCTNERWVEDQLANERSKRHGDAVDD